MKIEYKKVSEENRHRMSTCIFKFNIASSILKKHYKKLACMSILFNTEQKNSGYIEKKNEQDFLMLVKEIERSNDDKCELSHKKAIEKVKSKRRNYCSFDDYVEDHLDLHLCLMSDKEKEEAYKSYIRK